MVVKKKSTKKAAAKPVAKRKTVAKKVAAPKAVAKAPAKVSGGWWGNSFTGAGALIAIVSFIGIISVFIGWLSFWNGGMHLGYSGWDLLLADADCKKFMLNNSWQVVIPLITFILSIIAFIAVVLPAFKVRTNKIATGVLVVICGLVMFILCLCFMFGQVGFEDWMTKNFIEFLAPGFYLTIGASIILILAGLAEAIKAGKA